MAPILKTPHTEAVFVTKHALKEGIVVASAIIRGDVAIIPGAYPWSSVKLGKLDWHRDFEKAQARAISMAVAKANQLERESARLRGLDFATQTEL